MGAVDFLLDDISHSDITNICVECVSVCLG